MINRRWVDQFTDVSGGVAGWSCRSSKSMGLLDWIYGAVMIEEEEG